jgi:O-antigen ligase
MTSSGVVTIGTWRGERDLRPWILGASLLLPIGLAAFVASPLLGVGVLGLLLAPVFVLWPRHALLLFVAMLPFDAVSVFGEADSALSLTRIAGLGLFAGWVLHLLVERRPIRITSGAWWLVAYVGFACASVVWAPDREVAFRALVTLVQLLLLMVMAANVLREPADVRRVMDVLLLSTVAVALIVMATVPVGTQHRVWLELFGHTENPNYVAAVLVFPAVAAIGLGMTRGVLGWWRLACVVPIAIATFLTGSRGGGIALVGGSVLIAALHRRMGIGVAALALGLVVLLPRVVPESTAEKLWSRYSSAEEDRLSGRLDIWRVGMAMAEDRPIAGGSFGSFSDSFYRYMLTAGVDPYFAHEHSRGNRGAHNVYLRALAELGVIGLVLLVFALWAHLRALWRARADALRRRSARARLALALLGVLASIVLFATTIDLLDTKAPWMWLGMSQALVCMVPPVARRRRA